MCKREEIVLKYLLKKSLLGVQEKKLNVSLSQRTSLRETSFSLAFTLLAEGLSPFIPPEVNSVLPLP